MSNLLQLLVLSSLVVGLAGCQDSANGETTEVSVTPSSASALFDTEMSKKGCELLSAELVSKTFGVPADALKQMKIMGCRYDWNNGHETVETGISMLQVHKSEAAAASWFESATRNRTAEEMQAEMAQVSGQIDQSAELDTDLKKSTAQNMLATISVEAIHFDDVADVGDEARVSNDGTVYVRKNNLSFMVSAYKGTMAPALDMQGVEISQMVKHAKQAADRWAAETAPQRKTDGVRLARAIVDGL